MAAISRMLSVPESSVLAEMASGDCTPSWRMALMRMMPNASEATASSVL